VSERTALGVAPCRWEQGLRENLQYDEDGNIKTKIIPAPLSRYREKPKGKTQTPSAPAVNLAERGDCWTLGV